MKPKRILGYSLLGLIALGGVAAAAIPGPQRMLVPTLYGLTEIAPGIYTDDVSKKDQWLSLMSECEKRDLAFFGELKSAPRHILCSHLACEHSFGATGDIAINYGYSIVHLPPKALEGFNVGAALMAHERAHAELHWRAGLMGMRHIPNWLDEGLASYVSKDPRLDPFYSREERAWIRQSRWFFDWGKFVGERGWRTAYGAASDNVRLLDEKLGHQGLLKFIDEAAVSGNFTKAFEAQGIDYMFSPGI